MDRLRIPQAGPLLAMVVLLVAMPQAHSDDLPPPVTRLSQTHFTKFFLRYSPTGSHIAYSRHYANRRAANQILVGLHLMKADGTDDRRLLSTFDREVQIQEHPSFSSDGKQLLISGGGNDTGNSAKDTFVCDLDSDLTATGLRKLIPGQGVTIGEEPCWSPDHKHLCAVSTTERLFVVDVFSKKVTQILQVDGTYCHQPDWSPDGEWISFATDRDSNVEIYKVRPDGTELTRLTESPGLDAHPRWSPDARWISFTSSRSGNYDVWVMRADGSDLRNLTQHETTDDQATWSPDGKSIAFVSMRDGGFDIYKMPVPEDMDLADKPYTKPVEKQASTTNDLNLRFSFDGPADNDQRVRDSSDRYVLELNGAKLRNDLGTSRALYFDGASAFATAGNPIILQRNGPLTVSLWVRPESTGGNGYIVSKHGWNIYLGSDQIPRFETRTADNQAWDTLVAKQPLPPKSWSMLTVVFDPSAQHNRIYINGKLSAESKRIDGAIGATSSHPLEFGHYVVSRTQRFHGSIDEVRIMSTASTAEQVAHQFDQEKDGFAP